HRLSFHPGVDLVARTGTPILAAAGGRVVFAGEKAGYGNAVEIDHGNGLVTRYGHASRRAGAAAPIYRRCRLLRPLDGPAPAFRSARQRCAGQSRRLPRAVRADASWLSLGAAGAPIAGWPAPRTP